MKQISLLGKDGDPIRYVGLEGENLKFEFEWFARTEDEGDYEVIQTVAPAEFPAIAARFGIDPTTDPLSMVQQISDMGRGEELKDALNSKEIYCEIFTWRS